MNRNLKYFLGFAAITVSLVYFSVSLTSYESPKQEYSGAEIKAFSYNNGAVTCFYIDNNGLKSYLSCVQTESQTVLQNGH